MKTIYADFNDFLSDGVLPLTSTGSVASIAGLPDRVEEGEEVWLSDGELWVVARVYYCADGTLEARGDWEFHDKAPTFID